MIALTVFSDTNTFEASQRMAKALCSSSLVPEHFRGEKNLGNALIALELAQRMDLSPMAVLQSLYVVHGRPAWSAQFLIASFNSSGKFTPISYEQVGEPGKATFGFVAKATVLATGEEVRGPAVTMETAERDGWAKRNDKYRSMPELMLRYRAATWMIRLIAPELAMGLVTVDEVQDMPPQERNVTPRPTADDLNAELKRVVVEPEVVEVAESVEVNSSGFDMSDPAQDEKPKIDRAWFRKMVSEAETVGDLDEIQEVLIAMKPEIPVAGFNAIAKVIAEKREKIAA